jgi:hypothetical protein
MEKFAYCYKGFLKFIYGLERVSSCLKDFFSDSKDFTYTIAAIGQMNFKDICFDQNRDMLKNALRRVINCAREN